MTALETYIAAMRPAVEAELQAALRPDAAEGLQYVQMMYYHMGWDENGQPVDGSGGKRVRPLMVLLAAAAAGADWRAALPFAAAVELIHNFSLLHDDIQDRSDTRRGRATVWTLWGEAQAINAGDAIFAYAFQAIQRAAGHLPAETCLTAYDLLGRTCIALTQGQERDMDFETRATVTIDEYRQMIGGKTAALIATAMELGAVAAQAPDDTRTHLREFGRHLGLAFQMRDDILGIWGDSADTGKSTASDIATRKKTMPVLYALERNQTLRQRYAQPHQDGDVAEIVALLDSTDARTYTEAEEQHHTDEALQHLTALEAASAPREAVAALRQLTALLLGRVN